jgi:hypothetical protein
MRRKPNDPKLYQKKNVSPQIIKVYEVLPKVLRVCLNCWGKKNQKATVGEKEAALSKKESLSAHTWKILGAMLEKLVRDDDSLSISKISRISEKKLFYSYCIWVYTVDVRNQNGCKV